MPGSSNIKAQPSEVVTPLAGYQLLGDSFLNKGTAFTESERDDFELREESHEGPKVTVVGGVESSQVGVALAAVHHDRCEIRLKKRQQRETPRDASVSVLEWMDSHEPVVQPGRTNNRILSFGLLV